MAKDGASEEEIAEALIEFIEEYGNLSRDYRLNPGLAKKKAREVARCVIKKELLYNIDMTSKKIDEWCCEIVFEDFFKYNYSTQKSVFNLFKFIKANILNGRDIIPISIEFKYEVLGFNSKNYNQVFNDLTELELLKCRSRGDNLRSSSSLYEWIGPSFSIKNDGYNYLFDFLLKKRYNKKYSFYIQKKIEEERLNAIST